MRICESALLCYFVVLPKQQGAGSTSLGPTHMGCTSMILSPALRSLEATKLLPCSPSSLTILNAEHSCLWLVHPFLWHCLPQYHTPPHPPQGLLSGFPQTAQAAVILKSRAYWGTQLTLTCGNMGASSRNMPTWESLNIWWVKGSKRLLAHFRFAVQ